MYIGFKPSCFVRETEVVLSSRMIELQMGIPALYNYGKEKAAIHHQLLNLKVRRTQLQLTINTLLSMCSVSIESSP